MIHNNYQESSQQPPFPSGLWFGTIFIFPYIENVIIPSDEVIFFTGVGQPPTSLRLAPVSLIHLPFGKRLHNYGKSPFFMGKSTISMAIFSKLKVSFPNCRLDFTEKTSQAAARVAAEHAQAENYWGENLEKHGEFLELCPL